MSRKDEQETQKVTDTNKLVTIFEENSAITKVAWNPNLKFGTWAVAGTYGGYLRVEDLKSMVEDLPLCSACFDNRYPMDISSV